MKFYKKFSFIVSCAFFIGSGLCFSQISDPVLPLDPQVKVGHLPNGFTYYIRKNAEPKNRVTMYLANKVGSILETDDQRGLAHFLEHMAFNGTTNFPKNELVNYLQKAGVRFGSDLNAYTSFDETVFQLPIPTDDPELLKNGFQIMRDWAHEETLDPLEIDKERGVILEEKRLGKGAQQRLQEKYLPVIFNQSRYAERIPIGTEEVLRNFKPEAIRRFYNDWYRPDLQALIVVGDIDVSETESTIVRLFSDLKNPVNVKKRVEYTIPLTNKNQFFRGTDKEMQGESIQIIVKHKGHPIKTVGDYHQSILNSIYNQVMSQRLFELSQQSNPPFIQSVTYISNFMVNLDATSCYAFCKPGEMEIGFKAVWTEIERIKRYGITQSELDRAKESILKQTESVFKEREKSPSDSYVKGYLATFLRGQASPGIDFEYKFTRTDLTRITKEEINELILNSWIDINRDILVTGPETSKDNLPDENTVNRWMKEVVQSNIDAYQDNVSDQALFTEDVVAGKIVSEKKLDGIGTTELKLNNGVKVVLKHTDFKNDEVVFYAFSPGGSSLYNDSDYQSASRSALVVDNSGVSGFSSLQLSKLLMGKKVNVTPFVDERIEGFSGDASPDDLETAFQLVHLYFTEPREDKDVYQGMLSQEKAWLAKRNNDPKAVFKDSVSAILGNYNIRRTGPSLKKLEQIDIDKAFALYKDRFADASDFTFVIVGAFDNEKIKPLVQRYFGSLPSNGRTEQARDLKIHIPSGMIAKEVKKGIEQKSSVNLVFSGTYTYCDDENNKLDALAKILTIRLLENLREKESGVYGVGAYVNYTKYPENRYSFYISFGCSPENVDKLIKSALQEVALLKTDGPLLELVNKVKAEDNRQFEVRQKENGFWLNYLADRYRNNENPETVLNYVSSLEKVTPAALKAAASKYLTDENYIRLVLYPETKK